MGAGGAVLRSLATFLYALEFCCAAIILGIYSYFLSVLADRNLGIAKQWKAVEGISGIAVVYTIFAVILTCFLGGKRFFALLGIIMDVLLVGGFIAIAILTRQATNSCSGIVTTPFGTGPVESTGPGFEGQATYQVNQGLACRLNKAVFAVAIIGAFLFLISALIQVWVSRHHQKEKKYGPGPNNNYTSGSGRRKLWQRKPKHSDKEAEAGAIGTAGGANGFRQSHDTGYTGSTINGGHNNLTTGNKYEAGNHAPVGTAVDHAGYHTGPTGTAVPNPYGYDHNNNRVPVTGTATNY